MIVVATLNSGLFSHIRQRVLSQVLSIVRAAIDRGEILRLHQAALLTFLVIVKAVLGHQRVDRLVLHYTF